jgi:hypothetical protein
MKKLSRVELDVVVNEIINGVREKEEKKCELILSMSGNKEIYLSKINEMELLLEKVESVKNELRDIEKEIEGDGIRLNFYNGNNYYGMNNKNKKYSVYLIEGTTMKGNFYNEVYNKVVLNNIDDEVNVKSFIEKFVKGFC